MNDPRPNRTEGDPLATWADRTLRQLPARRAPSTLAPRVLAWLARQQTLPWYQRPWFRWPRHFQLLSVVLGAAIAGAVIWFLLPHADAVSLASAKQAAEQFQPVRDVATTAGIFTTLGNALLLVVKSLNGWLLATLLGAFAVAWSTTLGLGTACWRLAAGSR